MSLVHRDPEHPHSLIEHASQQSTVLVFEVGDVPPVLGKYFRCQLGEETTAQVSVEVMIAQRWMLQAATDSRNCLEEKKLPVDLVKLAKLQLDCSYLQSGKNPLHNFVSDEFIHFAKANVVPQR